MSGGGGVSLQLILITWPQAARQMRGVGGEGGEEGWRGTDNSSWQPLFLFLLVFLSAVCSAIQSLFPISPTNMQLQSTVWGEGGPGDQYPRHVSVTLQILIWNLHKWLLGCPPNSVDTEFRVFFFTSVTGCLLPNPRKETCKMPPFFRQVNLWTKRFFACFRCTFIHQQTIHLI